MAERAVDANSVTCFEDANGVIGWEDDDGNWVGFNIAVPDGFCIPAGLQQFTCRFE